MKKLITFLFFTFLSVFELSYAQTLATGPWPIRGQNLQHTGVSTSLYSASDSLKWSFPTGNSITSSPTVGPDGAVYFGSYDFNLYAVNADGSLKWSYLTGGVIWSSPTIASDGTVYVGSGDNYLYAINANGTLKWRYQTGNWVYSSPAIGTDGTIYVGSYDNYLYALTTNGTLKWRYQTGNSIYSSPAISTGGIIYVGSGDNYLYAINANGTLKWKYLTNGWVYSSPSVGTDGTIYVGSGDNYLYAITANGALKWRYQTGNSIISSPSVGADSTIYVGSYDNNLYALAYNGTLKWKFQTANSVYSSPLIGSDGTLYFGSLDKNIYALTMNGALKWNYFTGGDIHFSSPAMSEDGTLYVGSYDHKLYAFYPDTPEIKVKSPNGGEIWTAGTEKNITWTCLNVPTVKIEYSIDNGSNWTTIIASVSGKSGTYQWTVPNTPSRFCRVRVSDTSNILLKDTSNTSFRILETPSLTVISPNGGEILSAYSQYLVTWQSVTVTNVKIEYSTNNGTSWSTIIQSTPSQGYYYWIVPAVSSINCILRISDTSDSLIKDVSNAVFSIGVPTIAIISPNGGEHWIAGSSKNILWTSSNVSEVKIDYSSDNGITWSTIVTTAPSNGSYNWTVPNITSKNCLIRITDSDINQITIKSNSSFYISPPPSILLSSPNGGEIWSTGELKNITWTSSNIENIMIEYSINNGTSWTTIISTISALTGSYTWTVPNTVSANCLIRISDITNIQVSDKSNTVFSISPPSVTLVSPNGGITYYAGISYNITWTSRGITNLKIEYSTNNGTAWTLVTASTTASSGSFAWTMPSVASTNCLVRITDTTNSLYTDKSDLVFTIASITLSSPNGGESWMAGTFHNITWTSSNTGNLKIEFSSNNGTSWTLIASDISQSLGSYTWTIPNNPSTNCLIRITGTTTELLTDVSNSVFTISPPPSITVTSPNGGENWMAGIAHNITWTSFSVSNIKIEYSLDNGSTYTVITASVASGGSYSWVIPNTTSTNCLIRITDTTNAAVTDKSNNVFTISPSPSITVVSPNGGESWIGSYTQSITWVSVNVSNVSIDYSVDNGVSYITIISSAPSSGSFSWTIPNSPSTKCLIKITDYSNNAVNDISNSVFTITQSPYVTLISPNGGEKWTAGTSHNIEWTSASVNSVKIEYTEDNGINYLPIISGISAASGAYQWIVPGNPSTSVRIKISDTSNNLVNDISDGNFTILPAPSITVISPNGGEIWYAGSMHHIEWDSDNVQKVRIEYSINSGDSWITIASDMDGSLMKYPWTLPDTVSTDCLIRITDISNSAVFGLSASKFSIGKLLPPTNFTAVDIPVNSEHQIHLSWSISTYESFIDGYRIYRSRIPDFVEPPIDITTIGSANELIEKEQNSTILVAALQRGENSYLDDYVIRSNVEYYYWIESYSGETSSYRVQANKVTNVENSVTGFYVYGAYPNPFNPNTTISYSIPESGNVKISVFNASGQEMAILFDGHADAGRHEVVFNASGLSSGVYFYRFVADGFTKNGKMLLMK